MGYLETVDDRGRRTQPTAAAAGAVGQPPEPRFPRLRRHDRQRQREAGRARARAAVGSREHRHAHRHDGRRSRRRDRRAGDHADAGGRDRHQPWRRHRASRRPARCGRPVRGGRRLDVRRRHAAGSPVLAEDRHQAGLGDHHRAQVQGQRQHARAPGRQEARPERDRRLQRVARPADRIRSVRAVPRDGLVHPDRPHHELRRSARACSTSRCAVRRTSTGRRST